MPTVDARTSILDCASRLFAEGGFAGTSMRALAKAAQTSQALIHHHFGTKRGLYQAVRQSLVDRLSAADIVDVPVDPAETEATEHIASSMARYAAFLQQNPEYLKLVSWARLEGDDEPWADPHQILEPLEQAMHALQQSGGLRADLDVGLHLALVGGIVEHWVANAAVLTRTFAPDLDVEAATRRFFAQTASVIAHGALPRSETP